MTVIEGYSTNECTSDIPDDPFDFNYYGGLQTIFHIDVIRQTVQYIIDKNWLNIDLDSSWNTNSFQFYAGDLFDVIPKVRDTIRP